MNMKFLKNLLISLVILGIVLVPSSKVFAATNQEQIDAVIAQLQTLLVQLIAELEEQVKILTASLPNSSSTLAIVSSTQAIVSSTQPVISTLPPVVTTIVSSTPPVTTAPTSNQTSTMPINNDPFAILKVLPYTSSQDGYGHFTSPIDPSLLTRDNLVAFFNATNFLVWKNRGTGEVVPIHMSIDPNDMYSLYQGTRPLDTYWDLLYNPIYNKTNPRFNVSLNDPSPTARKIAQHLQDWLTEYPSAFTDPH
jgi:hypothetical protein